MVLKEFAVGSREEGLETPALASALGADNPPNVGLRSPSKFLTPAISRADKRVNQAHLETMELTVHL